MVLAYRDEPSEIDGRPGRKLTAGLCPGRGSLSVAWQRLQHVTAIGVGVPGPVVAKLGMVSAPPIMPDWDAFPIRQRMQDHWHTPTDLDNDANLGALGEWTFGVGRGGSPI